MNVYIVGVGERDEGIYPEAAYTTLRAAKRHHWVKHGIRVGNAHPLFGDRWSGGVNGTDEVWIYRMAVAS